jgi:hypothetical protein
VTAEEKEQQEIVNNFLFCGILPICTCVLSRYMETLLDFELNA